MELVIGALVVAVLVLVVVVLVIIRRMGEVAAPSPQDDRQALLDRKVDDLIAAQQQLVGQVKAVSDSQVQTSKAITDTVSQSQAQLAKEVNARLEKVNAAVGETLTDSAQKTAKSLGDLTARLEAIDKAQANIAGLADEVVSLRHVLDNNQARGAFGEVVLENLIEQMLPPSAYSLQKRLQDGRIVDCLILLPDPPGPIAVDAKFPLTAYKTMIEAEDKTVREAARKQLTADSRNHVRVIAEKYVSRSIDGYTSTSETALMFIPSEAVYAELHAHHEVVIDECRKQKVYLVSPTTLMATLTTIRAILRDVEMREQAGVIQKEVGVMLQDVRRLNERVEKLDKHFNDVTEDIRQVKISAGKIHDRGGRIESLELDDPGAIGSSQRDQLPLG